MSTETHVFFRGKLPSKAALSRAMKELGFPFSIKPATGSLEQQSGFMPMLLRREETGVEFDVYGDHAAVEELADAGVDPGYERRASFRWGGDLQEAVAGMCAAAALARLVNGVVFDEGENRVLTVGEAIEVAQKNLKELAPPLKRRLPRGPSALKRVLAPLLAKRSDLVLVDRLLLIRPVRHLIRGAVFRWHGRGMVCSAAPYIRPLYQPSELFLEDAVVSGSIEDPDFAPMLFDRLAAEVFGLLGKITSIEDFMESSWGKRLLPDELFHSIVVARGIEQAKSYHASFDAGRAQFLADCNARLAAVDRKDAFAVQTRKLELKSAEQSMEEARGRHTFLGRGDTEVFTYYRAWETEVARGMKIADVWEPSPFSARLPPRRRAAETSDPLFAPTPWLDFPTTWRQDPPETPGEMRFGIDWWDHRRGRPVVLLHPITREQAEARHRNSEGYTLMVRLPERQLLVLTHCGSTKERQRYAPYLLHIYDARRRHLRAEFPRDRGAPGMLRMGTVKISMLDGGRGGWESSLSFQSKEIAIRDYTASENRYDRRPMTDAQMNACTFPEPMFGQFGIFWQRISMHIETEGLRAFA